MDKDELLKNYYQKIYKLALYQLQDKQEAEDLTHDIFFKVLNSLGSFQSRSDIYTWIYRIALNTIRNYLRRKKIVKFISFEYEPVEASKLLTGPGDDPARKNEEEQEKFLKLKMLENAMTKLSEREKSAFFFFHFEKLKQKEIAEIMNTSVSAVESLIFKSMKKIRKYIA
ncbi:MAG: RNA polymerase sigma factor [Acidobacteriota bacterium]